MSASLYSIVTMPTYLGFIKIPCSSISAKTSEAKDSSIALKTPLPKTRESRLSILSIQCLVRRPSGRVAHVGNDEVFEGNFELQSIVWPFVGVGTSKG